MSAADILTQPRLLSFEVAPPKTDMGMRSLCAEGGGLEQLYSLNPAGIACTYSPGGVNLGKNLEVLDKVVRDGKTTAMTHFTCAGNTREGICAQLQTYLDHGIRHIFAQQGALPAFGTATGQLQYASELVHLVRERFGGSFTIAVAGAPEGRRCLEEDVELLLRKQDAGADFIITRPCWDVERFYRWLDAVLAAGIRMPVTVGVMPVLDLADTVNKSLSNNGAAVPQALSDLISRHWIYPNPFVKDPFDAEAEKKKAAFKAAGIDYTIRQIEAYRACGVKGIHLHTQNRFEDAARIVRDADLK